MIKAVFFDIDGTLVSFRTHSVPASTQQAIRLLREKGVKVFIATGRSFLAINNLGDLEFDGYITLNGSYCFAGKNEVIYKRMIEPANIQALLDYEEKVESFPCMFIQEENMFLNYKDERVDEVLKLLNFPEPSICNLRDVSQKEIFQLLIFFGEHQEERILQVIPDCDATRWTSLFADVVPKGGSKRVGIDKIMDHYGFSLEETMAFGDGGNDIEMLQHVGLGIAMGNAETYVKEVADDVTDSVDDDGILKALKKYSIL